MRKNYHPHDNGFSHDMGHHPKHFPLHGELAATGESSLRDRRIKRVVGNLYECHVDGTLCNHRFSFGYGKYCSWLLNIRSLGPDHAPPCFCSEEECEHAE
jgi:hypothetical protein